jgi:hypothetical protein
MVGVESPITLADVGVALLKKDDPKLAIGFNPGRADDDDNALAPSIPS